jgi:hypothetical protein
MWFVERGTKVDAVRLIADPNHSGSEDYWDRARLACAEHPDFGAGALFQLLDDGEIMLTFRAAVALWEILERVHGFRNIARGTTALRFEPVAWSSLPGLTFDSPTKDFKK